LKINQVGAEVKSWQISKPGPNLDEKRMGKLLDERRSGIVNPSLICQATISNQTGLSNMATEQEDFQTIHLHCLTLYPGWLGHATNIKRKKYLRRTCQFFSLF
jgi:hypothetical protein|tara:strand:+ start:1622 stop:1930 length:309 start_codon:yes stop_codon:yes gene_type:complete